MLVLQAVPRGDLDAWKMLRARIRAATTWSWGNKARTRLKHVQRPKGGHIDISRANGVLIAHIHTKTPNDLFYLAEKFTGRLVAWFEGQLLAINVQFVEEEKPEGRKRRKRREGRKRRSGRTKPTKRTKVTRRTGRTKPKKRVARRKATKRRR
jgi:hypothetical protein